MKQRERKKERDFEIIFQILLFLFFFFQFPRYGGYLNRAEQEGDKYGRFVVLWAG